MRLHDIKSQVHISTAMRVGLWKPAYCDCEMNVINLEKSVPHQRRPHVLALGGLLHSFSKDYHLERDRRKTMSRWKNKFADYRCAG